MVLVGLVLSLHLFELELGLLVLELRVDLSVNLSEHVVVVDIGVVGRDVRPGLDIEVYPAKGLIDTQHLAIRVAEELGALRQTLLELSVEDIVLVELAGLHSLQRVQHGCLLCRTERSKVDGSRCLGAWLRFYAFKRRSAVINSVIVLHHHDFAGLGCVVYVLVGGAWFDVQSKGRRDTLRLDAV